MEIKCLVVAVFKITGRKSRFVVVEILNPEINFKLTENSKLAGYPIEPLFHLLRILNKDGTPRLNTYGIRPVGVVNWDDFKQDQIVLLRDIEIC
ncbi:hypothetical protein QQ054_35465 [Oscillatoria amoena NRMC-F 0135]|nr:hypothetical protein [Oscillatoria amoena NRMC-F 0135]